MTARLTVRMLAWLAAAIIGLGAPSAFGDSIELKRNARVPAHQPLLLEDIATLTGNAAQQLAWTEVRSDAGGDRFRIEMRELRTLLEEAGVRWSDLELSGSACTVLPVDPERLEQRVRARSEQRAAESSADAPKWRGSGQTVRTAVGGYLCRLLTVHPDDLQIRFHDNASKLLDLPSTGRQIEVRPVGSGETIPLRIAVYQGDRLIAEQTIRADVRVRRDAVVMTQSIRRGDMIPDSAVTTEERWLAIDADPATLGEVQGAEARAHLEPGRAVMDRDVDRPIAIERGDRVVVRCISGGIVLRMEAYAVESGRVGDLIELRPLGARRNRVGFTARVEAPGIAVTNTNPTSG